MQCLVRSNPLFDGVVFARTGYAASLEQRHSRAAKTTALCVPARTQAGAVMVPWTIA